ncbi:MAG: Gfo/Idh/MocA family oxidoreductase [Candidatus Latescibacterota bacterium]|nr:Gfo/Idh/MocA family oxidoreductase [Candidatus Latescibacterota bacterium]
MLKAGFIGAGGRGQSAHYPSVHRLADQVEMAAVCELDEERLQQVVEKYDFQHTFTDHRALLDEIDPDIVYCVMNEKWLLQPVLDCIAAGKHLFIEKPPGAHSDETRQILEAAEKHKAWVMVGLQRRFTAVTREAMRLVAAKGPVSLATTTFNKQLPQRADEFTTTLWNDLVHIVDLLRYMAGGEPTEVTAYQDKFGGEGFDHYTALVRFDNNATGVMFGNRASGGRVIRSELHGVGVGCYIKIPEEIEIHEDNQTRTLGGWEIDGVDKDDVPRYEGLLHMHEHFIDCVNNKTQPLTDIRDVIHSIGLVDQIEAAEIMEAKK